MMMILATFDGKLLLLLLNRSNDPGREHTSQKYRKNTVGGWISRSQEARLSKQVIYIQN